jgi:NTE family protein
MKIGLVLPGGGAKGAYQMGVIHRLYNDVPNFKPSLISGVSVGALNGAMIAQGKTQEMFDIWHNRKLRASITKGRVNFINSLMTILPFWRKGIMSNKPLRRMLTKHIDPEKINTDFRIGLCSLYDQEYYELKHSDFPDKEALIDGILASTVIPMVWPPVSTVRVKNKVLINCVDGGLRNISPLRAVTEEDLDMVIIVPNKPYNSIYANFGEINPNIFQISQTSLAIAIDEIFHSDLDKFLKINEIVKSSTLPVSLQEKYKYIKTVLVAPKVDLGDTLYFEYNDSVKSIGIKSRYELGYSAGGILKDIITNGV